MYVVTVTFTVEAAAIDRFRARVKIQADDSLRLEPGCRRFDVCADPERPNQIFLYEIYDSAEAFQAHLASEHFHAFDAEVTRITISKDVHTWQLI